jgi:hypothetical protein
VLPEKALHESSVRVPSVLAVAYSPKVWIKASTYSWTEAVNFTVQTEEGPQVDGVAKVKTFSVSTAVAERLPGGETPPFSTAWMDPSPVVKGLDAPTDTAA